MRKSLLGATVSTLFATVLLMSCGGEKPEAMLASAKDYMAKRDNKAAIIQLKNALQGDPNMAEARFLLGRALLDSGNPAGAEVELRKARELNYPADKVTPLLANVLLMVGQPKKIIDDLAKVEMSSPESKADLQTTVGYAYLATGKADAAQSAFGAALSAVPGYPPAIVAQARVKAGNRDFSGALALLDSALEKTPALHDAWQLKGDILQTQGDANGASAAYAKALEVKPDYLPAHMSITARLLEEGKLDEAGKQLEAMSKIAPGSPQTTYMQAQLAYQKRDFKAAQEAIQRHLKVAPDSPLGLQLAGAIEYELKSYSTAEAHLLKALPNTPELGMARRVLIASYLRSNQPDKALRAMQPILSKIDDNSNMLALAGEVYMQNGDADKAASYFAKAAALDPNSAGKRTSVALARLAKGDSDSATRELERIASADSGTRADLGLIASQLKDRKFDEALKAIDSLEKKQPDNPLTFNLRGIALLGKRDVPAARKNFETALTKNPAYFPAAASLANLDLTEKKPDDAKKRFESVIASDPKSIPALLALAELKAKTGGKADEVAALINKAITANPTEPAPHIALVGLYLSTKESRKALAAAQDALGVLPDRPEILDAAGRAQQAAEEYNQALTTYSKLAGLVPNSPQPYLRMAEINLVAKNKDAAMQNLNKALSVKPDSLETQRAIMMLDLEAGKTDAALTVARNVQKQRPKESAGYVLEGDVYALKKSWPEAISAYKNGIKQSGATELAIKTHAALNSSGKSSEADGFADGWLKEHAKDMQFRLYLAESATARKDFATASKLYKILVDVQPDNALLLNNLAWSLAQNKDPKAVDYAEKAYKLAPEQAAIADTLGGLLVDKGDTARGIELLQKAVSLAPQNPPIRLNYAKALAKAGKKDEAKKELEELSKLGDKFADQNEVSKLLQSL